MSGRATPSVALGGEGTERYSSKAWAAYDVTARWAAIARQVPGQFERLRGPRCA